MHALLLDKSTAVINKLKLTLFGLGTGTQRFVPLQ